jgi:glycolate oxidase iron-sulfur subunit
MAPPRATEAADLCVKCGACLPHCPTYAFTRDEAESPRGRVALVQGLDTGLLAPSPRLASHLDACLGCRACEPVCPAGVPVTAIVDAGRTSLRVAGQHERWPVRLARALAARPHLARILCTLLRAGERTGLWRLLQRFTPGSAVLRLAAALPTGTTPGLSASAPDARARLFLGCFAPALDAATLAATARVYARYGHPLAIPDGQVCCGALHAHGGDPAGAAALAPHTARAFAGAQPVIACATGCSLQLRDAARGAGLSAPIHDAVSHLATLEPATPLAFHALPLRVAVQAPCSQRIGLRAPDATTRLLARIPGLMLQTPAQPGCCGMGGAQGVGSAAQARALGRAAAASFLAGDPELIVSANWGCALQLRAGLAELGRPDLEVVHPIELVDRSLADPGL